jgi:hypothetical protein
MKLLIMQSSPASHHFLPLRSIKYISQWDENTITNGKDLEGDDSVLFQGTIPEIGWRDWEKQRETSFNTIGRDMNWVTTTLTCSVNREVIQDESIGNPIHTSKQRIIKKRNKRVEMNDCRAVKMF